MKYKFAPAFLTKSFSRLYDPLTNLIGAGDSLQRKIVDVGDIKDTDKIADIGCGTARFLFIIKQIHPILDATGVDPDEQILNIAKEKFRKFNVEVKLVEAFAENLPFPEQSFNKIFSTLTFHHLPREVKRLALKEIYRVLETRGKFFLTDIGKPKNLFWKYMLAFESLFERKEYLKDNLEGELPLLMKEAGFTSKEVLEPYLGIRFYLGQKA